MEFLGYQAGIVIISLSVGAAMLGLAITRRVLSLDTLKAGHEVSGNLLSVIGTMYAVLLGLVVVDAMSHFQRAIDIVQTEANCVADVFLLAERMPEQKRAAIQDICFRYVKEVVEKEWPLMENGQHSERARSLAIVLTKAATDFEPVTESQKAVYPIMIEESMQLWDCRRARTNVSQFGIPEVEWVVLVAGGVVTVFFTFLFGMERARFQMGMTAIVAFVFALNLYLVYLYGYPFSGELKVSARPFHVDMMIFEGKLGMGTYKPPSTY